MEQLKLECRATGTLRYNFAVQHMMAAARFAKHCHQIEKKNAGQPFGPFFDEVLSYVSASVQSAVAALEANINETFADIQDGITVVGGFDCQTLQESWSEIEGLSILAKYNRYLELKERDGLDASARQFQFAKILISVRNALVHYKPEWHDEQKVHKKISRRLRGKFTLSPFVDDNAPIFPMRCMTYSFADWTVQSTLNFTEWFASTSGIPNRFAQFKDRFCTSSE